MITKIITSGSNANSAAYSALFEEASKILGVTQEEEYIDTLNKYFVHLKALIEEIDRSEDEQLKKKKSKFIRLPLDEDFFVIDANTRKIKIPDSFSSGASVQGDQGAETIFFIIDRYFDAMDLNTQDIYIEWSNSAESGLSPAFARDTESQPDKIIFGWLLEDVITQVAGPVDFAVRFYSTKKDPESAEDEILTYSFSTIPHKIVINKSLNFDLVNNTHQVLRPEDLFYERLLKGRAPEEDSSSSDIDPPTILVDVSDDKMNSKYNYKNVILDSDTGKASFLFQGAAPNRIEYSSEKQNDSGKFEQGPNFKYPAGTIEYLKTEDTERVANKTYYRCIGDPIKEDAYSTYDGPIPMESGEPLYERYGKLIVDQVGVYKGRIDNKKGLMKKTAYTQTVVVPGPEKPVINTATQHIKLEGESVTFGLEEAPKVTQGTLTYQWYRKVGDAYEPIDEATGIQYTSSTEDYYQLIPTNTLNKESVNGEACIYRVSYPAGTPKFSVTPPYGAVKIGDTLQINISADNKQADKTYVTWYETKDTNMIDPSVDAEVQPKTEVQDTISKYLVVGPGQYYAVIENEYNTFIASVITGNESGGTWQAVV